jgi:hypothetical protein
MGDNWGNNQGYGDQGYYDQNAAQDAGYAAGRVGM